MRFLLLFFLSLSALVHGQRIKNADAVFTGSVIAVRFTIAAGPYCSGYSVWHTADSTAFFNNVYDYPGGICGDPSNDEAHMFQHSGYTPGVTNYYKIRLEPFEESPIIRVYAGAAPLNQITMYPNPCGPSDEELHVRLTGAADDAEVEGFIYGRGGEKRGDLFFRLNKGSFTVNVSPLDQGIYVLWLTDGKTLYRGKFIVID